MVVVPEVPELAVLSGAHASKDLLHSSLSLSSASTSKYGKKQTFHKNIVMLYGLCILAGYYKIVFWALVAICINQMEKNVGWSKEIKSYLVYTSLLELSYVTSTKHGDTGLLPKNFVGIIQKRPVI